MFNRRLTKRTEFDIILIDNFDREGTNMRLYFEEYAHFVRGYNDETKSKDKRA